MYIHTGSDGNDDQLSDRLELNLDGLNQTRGKPDIYICNRADKNRYFGTLRLYSARNSYQIFVQHDSPRKDEAKKKKNKIPTVWETKKSILLKKGIMRRRARHRVRDDDDGPASYST